MTQATKRLVEAAKAVKLSTVYPPDVQKNHRFANEWKELHDAIAAVEAEPEPLEKLGTCSVWVGGTPAEKCGLPRIEGGPEANRGHNGPHRPPSTLPDKRTRLVGPQHSSTAEHGARVLNRKMVALQAKAAKYDAVAHEVLKSYHQHLPHKPPVGGCSLCQLKALSEP